MTPQVSILLPCYNSAPFLQATLDSLSAQTFTDWECIAIDDGSTDPSAAILHAHAERDPRFKVISRPNKGLIATLNEGIALAQAPWIARMDGDDLAAPERLAVQLAALDISGADVCGSWVQFFGDRSGVWQTPLDDAAIKLQLLFNVPLAHPSVVVRAQLLRAQPYDARATHAEDYALWCALAQRGARFMNVPQPLLRYRCHAGQITQSRRDELRQTAQRIRADYAANMLPPNIDVAEFVRFAEPGTQLSPQAFTEYAWMLLGLATMYPAGQGVLAEAWIEAWQRTQPSRSTLGVVRRLRRTLPFAASRRAFFGKQWLKHAMGTTLRRLIQPSARRKT